MSISEKTQNTQSTNHLSLHEISPYVRSKFSSRHRVAISFPAQGRTKQSFKDECDINTIMARYTATGVLPDSLNPRTPQYIDATGFDFDLAMNLVADATNSFKMLPAKIRAQFDHDPGAFLDFVANPENGPALVAMGLSTQLPEWAGGGTTATPEKLNQGAANPLQNQNPPTTAPSGEPAKSA